MVKRIKKLKLTKRKSSNSSLSSSQMQTRGKKLLKDCYICYNKIEIQGRINCCSHLFCLCCIQKWSNV